VRPPSAVLEGLGARPRPPGEGWRWTRPEQWHVTLRFLGDADERAAAGALGGLRSPPVTARLGPTAKTIGQGVLHLPVAGLDELAAAVVGLTDGVAEAPVDHAFRGHLTLARRRGGRSAPPELRFEAAWTVEEIELVRSEVGRDGARHEVVARFPLAA
jgi:RNA 2',3'-cyclic 3'-phosphodiesterase